MPLLFSFTDPDTGTPILYPSLALEALRVAQDAKTIIKIKQLDPKEAGNFDPPLRMKVGEYEIYRSTWMESFSCILARSATRTTSPAWTVINGSADPAKIKDKIVFVGTSASGLKDLRSTPINLFVPGVEAHVNVVEQIPARAIFCTALKLSRVRNS